MRRRSSLRLISGGGGNLQMTSADSKMESEERKKINRLIALDSIDSLITLTMRASILLLTTVCFLCPELVQAQQQQQQQQINPAIIEYFNQLRKTDTCGTIFTSKSHGYDLREYKVITKDNYELGIHRLIHPSDFATHGPVPRKKKPYLLLHGLIGTSASYVVSVDEQYAAPQQTFNAKEAVKHAIESNQASYEHFWQSTAQLRHKTHERDQDSFDRWSKKEKQYAQLSQLDYDADQLNFAHVFKQTYRKFHLPQEALSPHVSNSLAFSLANFGYDVWLINLRGNQYSRGYNGPSKTADWSAEYWDFDINTLIREDLLAVINFVKKQVDCDDPMGVVGFSYSNANLLGLLAGYPAYLEQLQPVFMLAPTMLAASEERSKSMQMLIKAIKLTLSKNGPFPAIGGRWKGNESKLEHLVCKMPLASKVCRLLEYIMNGQTKEIKTVKGLILPDERRTKLVKHDNSCGQTSKAVLHQIVDNLSSESIDQRFWPSVAANQLASRGKSCRRSVILMHSLADEISTQSEVNKIRDTALKSLTLVDHVISEPDFGHTDFLFSKKNQYLVNAEVVRMALVYDALLYRPSANRRLEAAHRAR